MDAIQVLQTPGMSGADYVAIAQIVSGFLTAVSLPMIGYYIRKLEKNTNSIKDELVKVTGEAEKAKGHLEGKAEGKIEGKAEEKAKNES